MRKLTHFWHRVPRSRDRFHCRFSARKSVPTLTRLSTDIFKESSHIYGTACREVGTSFIAASVLKSVPTSTRLSADIFSSVSTCTPCRRADYRCCTVYEIHMCLRIGIGTDFPTLPSNIQRCQRGKHIVTVRIIVCVSMLWVCDTTVRKPLFGPFVI